MSESKPATRLRIEPRPVPVLPEQRPLYRLSLIVLVLRLASAGGKSSLARLHLFNWVLKQPDRAPLLIAAAETKELDIPAWGFDPTLDAALRFGLAERVLEATSTGFALTPHGAEWADAISGSSIAVPEKALLEKLRKRITEKMVDVVAKRWKDEA